VLQLLEQVQLKQLPFPVVVEEEVVEVDLLSIHILLRQVKHNFQELMSSVLRLLLMLELLMFITTVFNLEL
tara:strand:- start:774 stop:986 length:213 start_codon:yes stop_codon:yes gene_type:complete